MGKKKPKRADTAGGRTPEMNVNDPGEALDHDWRKGTKEVSDAKFARIDMTKSGIVLKKQTRLRNIHPIVFLARNSAGDWLRLSQICKCVNTLIKLCSDR